MRVSIKSESEEIIEKDNRFSKANFGSRKNYSIVSAILQKRLIFDDSLISRQHAICTMTDLKANYNRQLSNIGSVVEESIGRNRCAMRLYAKIIRHFQNHVNTVYGISEEYGG